MRLTPDDLRGRRLLNPMHVDFARAHSAWIYRVEGEPRLTVQYDVDRQGRKTRTLLVDNQPVPDLEAACAVLNGDKTVEQVMSDAAAAKRRKISLHAQIEEIDYELGQRRNVYARIASSDPKRRSELDYHVLRLEAVRDTLLWLQQHEALIRQRLAG